MTGLANFVKAKSRAFQSHVPTGFRRVAKVLQASQDEVFSSQIRQPLNSLVYTESRTQSGNMHRDHFLIVAHEADGTRLFPLSNTPFLAPGQRIYADADWEKIYVARHLLGKTVDAFGLQQGDLVSYTPQDGWVDKQSVFFYDVPQTSSDDEDLITPSNDDENQLGLRFGSWARFGDGLPFSEASAALASSPDFDVIIILSPGDRLRLKLVPEEDAAFDARFVHIKPGTFAKDLEDRVARLIAIAMAQGFSRRGMEVALVVDRSIAGRAETFNMGGRDYIAPFRDVDLSEFCGLYNNGSVTGFFDASWTPSEAVMPAVGQAFETMDAGTEQ